MKKPSVALVCLDIVLEILWVVAIVALQFVEDEFAPLLVLVMVVDAVVTGLLMSLTAVVAYVERMEFVVQVALATVASSALAFVASEQYLLLNNLPNIKEKNELNVFCVKAMT